MFCLYTFHLDILFLVVLCSFYDKNFSKNNCIYFLPKVLGLLPFPAHFILISLVDVSILKAYLKFRFHTWKLVSFSLTYFLNPYLPSKIQERTFKYLFPYCVLYSLPPSFPPSLLLSLLLSLFFSSSYFFNENITFGLSVNLSDSLFNLMLVQDSTSPH